MYKCSYCGKECRNHNSWRNHERCCKLNPSYKSEYECRYCGRRFPRINYLNTHEKSCWNNPSRIPFPAWNRGLTKETDIRVAKEAQAVKNFYKEHPGTFRGKHHSAETRNKMRARALLNKNEQHFGRKRVFEYRGCKFISSYEVEVAKSLDENHVEWIQPKRFPYRDLEGKLHYYTPDLYLPEFDIYLDPKNDYLINSTNPHLGYRDVDKIRWAEKYNNIKVFILDKNHLNWDSIKDLMCRSGGVDELV